jgi:hypothetical protein
MVFSDENLWNGNQGNWYGMCPAVPIEVPLFPHYALAQ